MSLPQGLGLLPHASVKAAAGARTERLRGAGRTLVGVGDSSFGTSLTPPGPRRGDAQGLLSPGCSFLQDPPPTLAQYQTALEGEAGGEPGASAEGTVELGKEGQWGLGTAGWQREEQKEVRLGLLGPGATDGCGASVLLLRGV